MLSETDNIRMRYERRPRRSYYSPLDSAMYMSQQERERTLIKWIRYAGLEPTGSKTVLEIGCGSGANLLQFLRLGFLPEHMVGVELLEERVNYARRILSPGLKIVCGDASELNYGEEQFDVVVQMTVFSSLLDHHFQKKMARHMWSLVKTGGGILWYDFIYNNPRNHDVKGIPIRKIRELFPEAEIKIWRVTLAPPISRLIAKFHPSLYTLFNFFPFLRTHVLCWIKK